MLLLLLIWNRKKCVWRSCERREILASKEKIQKAAFVTRNSVTLCRYLHVLHCIALCTRGLQSMCPGCTLLIRVLFSMYNGVFYNIQVQSLVGHNFLQISSTTLRIEFLIMSWVQFLCPQCCHVTLYLSCDRSKCPSLLAVSFYSGSMVLYDQRTFWFTRVLYCLWQNLSLKITDYPDKGEFAASDVPRLGITRASGTYLP